MKRNAGKYYLGLLVVIFVLILGVKLATGKLSNSPETEHNLENDSREDLALCLKQKEVIMYGVDTCQFCQEQKSMFGDDFQQIDYVNCDFDKELCQAAKVTTYPSWLINNQIYSGVRNLEELAKISNCSIKL